MKRVQHEQVSWHVIMRGVRRLPLFREDTDRRAFLGIMGESMERRSVRMHAYVLMDNHYHLLLTAPWDALGEFMHDLNRLFSRGANSKYRLKGQSYEGPYKAFPQSTPFWMGRTARYIDFNPVKAGLSRTPEQYPWSSCRAYVKGSPPPIPLDQEPVLKALGGLERYKRFVPPVYSKTVGSTITAMDVWVEQVVWILHYAREQSKALEGEDPKTIAVAWARVAGIPPRAIAKALDYASGHSVSVLLDSVRKRARKNAPLRKLLNRNDA